MTGFIKVNFKEAVRVSPVKHGHDYVIIMCTFYDLKVLFGHIPHLTVYNSSFIFSQTIILVYFILSIIGPRISD